MFFVQVKSKIRWIFFYFWLFTRSKVKKKGPISDFEFQILLKVKNRQKTRKWIWLAYISWTQTAKRFLKGWGYIWGCILGGSRSKMSIEDSYRELFSRKGIWWWFPKILTSKTLPVSRKSIFEDSLEFRTPYSSWSWTGRPIFLEMTNTVCIPNPPCC